MSLYPTLPGTVIHSYDQLPVAVRTLLDLISNEEVTEVEKIVLRDALRDLTETEEFGLKTLCPKCHEDGPCSFCIESDLEYCEACIVYVGKLVCNMGDCSYELKKEEDMMEGA